MGWFNNENKFRLIELNAENEGLRQELEQTIAELKEVATELESLKQHSAEREH